MYSVNFITDFEGCMADSEENWIGMYSEWSNVLKEHKCTLSHEEIFQIVAEEDMKLGVDFHSDFPYANLIKRICERTQTNFSNEIVEEWQKGAEVLHRPAKLRQGFEQVLPLLTQPFYIVSDVSKNWIENTVKHWNLNVKDVVTGREYGTRDKKILYEKVLKKEEKNLILGDILYKDIRPANELKSEYEIVTIHYPYKGKRLPWWDWVAKKYATENIKPDYTANDENLPKIFQKELFK
ncbi:MAG: hypothetical protein QMD14_03035 [Candidatus Aenigmarchaeota archaeon]|nr:hypothetical protein [Candidatus Aenigmarchaeota archaeon]